MINYRSTKALICLFAILIQCFSSLLSIVPNNTALAQSNDDAMCAQIASFDTVEPAITEAYGGVKLDKAAEFLANMSDITGAYYDQTKNVIVFMGKTNTTMPQFDRDDLAVAIKAIIFNNSIPAVSIDYVDLNNITGYPYMKVNFTGGIENTKFGKTLFDADLQLKRYIVGYDENGTQIRSSVPGYNSVLNRWVSYKPNRSLNAASRWWISPKSITIKKDDTNGAFVFDQVVMQIQTEGLVSNLDPAWTKAASDFANHQTQYFDSFANEVPSYQKTKQLAKITSVIKWLKDNLVDTDYEWARNYVPTLVPTPTQTPRITSPTISGYWITGGVQYTTANSYNADTTGASSILKTAANNASSTSTNGISWTFNSSGQTYQAVEVSADLFKSTGAYTHNQTDLTYPTISSKLPLQISRSYSSFDTSKNEGFGYGWSYMPASLTDMIPGFGTTCGTSYGATYNALKLSFNHYGNRETFTFKDCATGYVPDDPTSHSTLVRDTQTYSYKATTKNKITYEFKTRWNYELSLSKISDQNNNSLVVSDLNLNGGLIKDEISGKWITITRNTNNQITSISSPTDTVKYTYDANGDLTTVTDIGGKVTRYTYDSLHRLTSVIDKTGVTNVTNAYDAINRVQSQTNISNIKRTISYNTTENSKTWTDTNGKTSKEIFDTKGNLIKSIDVLGGAITYTYGTTSSLPVTITDPKGNTTSITYDAKGNITSLTMPDGGILNYTYDSNNNLLTKSDTRYTSVNGNPKTVTNTYDVNGNLTGTNIAGISSVSYGYNSNGKIREIFDAQGNITSFTYNSQGLPSEVTDPLGRKTTYTYNDLGKVLTVTDPQGVITSFTYSTYGNLLTATSPFGTVTNTYDDAGRLTSTVDSTNAKITNSYDSAGNLTAVTDPLNNTTKYTYDPYRNLIKSTDPKNNTTLIEYDKLDREISYKTPLGKTYKTGYDANSNTISRITPDAITQSAIYDALDRITQTTIGTRVHSYTYDKAGRLTTVAGPDGTTSYTYDILDRVIEVKDTNNLVTKYTYDANNNLTQLTYPDAKIIKYKYNAKNSLIEVSDWNGDITKFAYNNSDLLVTKTLPNKITATYTYDKGNRLESISYTDDIKELIFKQTYTRDSRGFPTQITEETGAGVTDTKTYNYDSLGRVIKSGTSNSTIEYQYDSLGNILKSTQSPKPTSYSTSTSPRDIPIQSNNKQTILSGVLGFIEEINPFGIPGAFAETTVASPIISPGPDTKTGSITLSFSTATPNAIIYYTTDGTTPTTSSTRFWGAPPMHQLPTLTSGTYSIRAVAVLSGVYSAVATKSVTVALPDAPLPTMYPTSSTINADSAISLSSALAGSTIYYTLDETIPTTNSIKYTAPFLLTKSPTTIKAIVVKSGYQNNGSYIQRTYTLAVPGPTISPASGTYLGAQTVSISDYVKDATIYYTTDGNKPTTSSSKYSAPFIVDKNTKISVFAVKTGYKNSDYSYANYIISSPPIITSFYAQPSTSPGIGMMTSLNWVLGGGSSGDTSYSTINNGVGDVTGKSSKNVGPYISTKYTLTTKNSVGSTAASTVITVPRTPVIAATITNTYDADNALISTVKSANGVTTTITQSYDANGNLITESGGTATRSLSWDNLGRLISVKDGSTTVASFIYDAVGNRIKKTNTSKTIKYVNDLTMANLVVLEEMDANNGVTTINVYGATGIISTGEASKASRLYPITDAQGSVRFLTTSTGGMLQMNDYTTYGDMKTTAGLTTSPYRYTGENLDSETGLYFLRARYYNPTTGRFISRDPLRGNLANPLSQNTYAYGLDNPMVYSDPSGMQYAGYALPLIQFGFSLEGLGIGADSTLFGVPVGVCLAIIGGAALITGGAMLLFDGKNYYIYNSEGLVLPRLPTGSIGLDKFLENLERIFGKDSELHGRIKECTSTGSRDNNYVDKEGNVYTEDGKGGYIDTGCNVYDFLSGF